MTTLAASFDHLDATPQASVPAVPDRLLVPPRPPATEPTGTFVDRCALLAMDLRSALEDRLPRLAALATHWFDADAGDDEESITDAPPRDPVFVRIDLAAFAAGLARRDGLPATPEDAADWLTAVGFQRCGDLWVGEREDLRLIGARGIEKVRAAGSA